ncbi:MAG: methyl-accepting chemotaxis protein [Sedimentibacter sp.]|uniref:methyl-accepting chemotaxis protein n=1 Tax=Sedimentibacter sp. TaxID=1960295 RepID=UPI0031587E97
MNKFNSLKTKLIVITSVIVFLTAVLNLTVGILTSYRSITQNVERDLKSIGQTVEVAIDTSIDNIKFGIMNAGKSDVFGQDEEDNSMLLKILDKIKDENGYRTLSIVDKNGIITSSDSGLNGKNIADQEYFKNAMSGETFMSTPTYNINNELCVIVTSPVTNGSYEGIVMAEMDAQVYSEIIKNIVVGETGNVFIIDKNGTMIANRRPELVESMANFIEKSKTDPAYESAASVYTNMTGGNTGVEIYSYDSGKRICYYAPIKGTDGWSYGAVAPITEMTSSILYTIVGLSVSSLLCVLFGVFMSMRAAKSIANPISMVCRRLEQLSKGDLLTETVRVDARDETGILSEALSRTVISLRSYISEITNTLQQVSEGNMTVKVESDFNGDFAPIKESLTNITMSLNSVLTDIRQAAEQVSSSADEVSGSAQALAQGATEQASSVEELSATIAEISENVRNNAENAEKASSNVNDVRSEIEVSNSYMKEMVLAMSDISYSSGEIGKIIKAIEDIAFQTNILALNAAVEAARAGSAGKGFAVVADEVRNLAGKSAEAAKNTTNLIENSMKQVENGTRIADRTAKSLLQVVESTRQVAEIVDHISQTSVMQAEAISQVTMGVEQISSVVQTNSATSEESAAASEEMSSQAQVMKTLVGKFKLEDQ